jgi:hypothetical protein
VLVGVRNSGHRQSGSSKNFEREEARKHENRERTPPVLSQFSFKSFLYTKKHGRRTSTNTLSNSNIIIIIIEKTCCIVVE